MSKITEFFKPTKNIEKQIEKNYRTESFASIFCDNCLRKKIVIKLIANFNVHTDIKKNWPTTHSNSEPYEFFSANLPTTPEQAYRLRRIYYNTFAISVLFVYVFFQYLHLFK